MQRTWGRTFSTEGIGSRKTLGEVGVLDRQKEPTEAEASGARKRMMKDANEHSS